MTFSVVGWKISFHRSRAALSAALSRERSDNDDKGAYGFRRGALLLEIEAVWPTEGTVSMG